MLTGDCDAGQPNNELVGPKQSKEMIYEEIFHVGAPLVGQVAVGVLRACELKCISEKSGDKVRGK